MTAHEITDERLTAYLDGELDAAQTAQLETALAAHPSLQDRLHALDVPLQALREEMGALLETAPNAVLPHPPASRPFPIAIASSALAAGLALGAFLMAQLAPQPKTPGWVDYVASYQALYSTATLANVRFDQTSQSLQLERVSAEVGRSLAQATRIPGMEFKRAQVLGYKGKPLIQLAYVTPQGVPMALCVIARTQPQALRQMELEGLASASWSDSTHAFLLIGGEDAELVGNAAQHLQEML